MRIVVRMVEVMIVEFMVVHAKINVQFFWIVVRVGVEIVCGLRGAHHHHQGIRV
jgi:hypothetical protein